MPGYYFRIALNERTTRRAGHLEEYGLASPILELRMEVDGSDRPDGYFGFKTIMRLAESDEDVERPDNFTDRFIDDFRGESLDEDESSFLIVSGWGYQYIFDVNDNHKLFTLRSAGKADGPDVNLAQRERRYLRHDDHSPEEAFKDFTEINKFLLTYLYEAYGQTNLSTTLTLRPFEQPEQSEPLLLPEAVAAPDVESVKLDDLGGISAVKDELMETVYALRNPEVLMAYKLPRPHGIFVHGPPGTGKTTLAKAVAGELGATYEIVLSSDIYGKWMGESESRAQGYIDKAKAATKPYVQIWDEIDGIIRPSGGSAYTTVATLIKQQIGTISEHNPNAVVIATSNKTADDIDEALFRPGRFDTHIYVPLPNEQDRQVIFGVVINSYFDAKRHIFDLNDLDFQALASATMDFSGADITEVIRKLVTAKAIMEIRTKTLPPPTGTKHILEVIDRQRRSKA